MSADLLREAAALLRQRAGFATPGPWWAMFRVPEVYAGSGSADDPLVAGETRLVADAAYIATMHPGVGLAIGPLLSALADRADAIKAASPNAAVAERVATLDLPGYREADALARAILGRQP